MLAQCGRGVGGRCGGGSKGRASADSTRSCLMHRRWGSERRARRVRVQRGVQRLGECPLQGRRRRVTRWWQDGRRGGCSGRTGERTARRRRVR
eukprot:1993949-Pleurochrysis_carterae.AAC.1